MLPPPQSHEGCLMIMGTTTDTATDMGTVTAMAL